MHKKEATNDNNVAANADSRSDDLKKKPH